MSSQRKDSRLPAKLEVAYRTQGAFLVSYSVNLSKGGIFLESTTPLPVGTEVTLRLDVPHAGAFDLVGQVAWVRQASPDGLPAGMGIQLHGLDERYGELIDRMVQDFTGLTVLVISEAPERLSLLARYVRSSMTCEILEATNILEVDNAIKAAPDLVVLDVDSGPGRRPSSLGVTTIDGIKRQPGDAGATPVILLAGDLRTRELGKQAGADEVLEAPPSFATLQAAIVRTLSRPAKVEGKP
jgi:uncharacterized protein (TIGR02266 family)